MVHLSDMIMMSPRQSLRSMHLQALNSVCNLQVAQHAFALRLKALKVEYQAESGFLQNGLLLVVL